MRDRMRDGREFEGDKPMLGRRAFVSVGAIGGLLALGGCSWTPRGATSSQSAAQPSSQAAGSDGGSQDIGDGLTSIKGGTFTMGSPSSEPWRSDDEEQHEVTVGDF